MRFFCQRLERSLRLLSVVRTLRCQFYMLAYFFVFYWGKLLGEKRTEVRSTVERTSVRLKWQAA